MENGIQLFNNQTLRLYTYSTSIQKRVNKCTWSASTPLTYLTKTRHFNNNKKNTLKSGRITC